MSGRSGLLQAGGILLLVGGVLAAFAAVMLVGFALLAVNLGAFADAADSGEAEDVVDFRLFGFIYGGLGLVAAAGSVFGLLAWRRVTTGDLRGAFHFGLVGSLLPPVQALTLLGTIFVKVCPEADDD